MKLYISQNIKKFRLNKSMTQEELAESLGVSFQSVSRWETGLSYPDIELIPEIAAFFEVSTDVLMGVDKAMLDQNLENDKKKMRMDTFDTIEERLAFLEETHRKYPHDAEILINLIHTLSLRPEHWQEMRKKIREYLCHPQAQKVYIDQAIRLLIASDDEKALPDLLNRYAAEENMSRTELLQYRAGYRNDLDAYKKYKQLNHLQMLLGILNNIHPYSWPPRFLYGGNTEEAAKRALAIINMLTNTQNRNFINGDGAPDLWYGNRLVYGFQLAGNYALDGRKEDALDILKSLVDLAEKFYSLPEGTVLTYRNPDISDLRETLHYSVRNPDDVIDFSENLYRCMRSDETFYGIDLMYSRTDEEAEFDHHVECAAWDIIPLIDTEEWDCFDSIRDHAKFQECVKRMRQYVIPVKVK